MVVVTTSGGFKVLCSMTMGANFGSGRVSLAAVSAAFPFETGVAGVA